MSKLEIAKKIIEENYKYADAGIFDCRNWCGDDMTTLYSQDGLIIDICYKHEYFEVFGLSKEEFEKLELFYEKL